MSTSIAPVKPMGTSASSAPMSFGGGGGGGSAMLVASIQQLSASIQSGGSAGGGGTNVNLTFNIDKSGNAGSEQGSENKTGQPSSSGDQEKEKQFGETIKVAKWYDCKLKWDQERFRVKVENSNLE